MSLHQEAAIEISLNLCPSLENKISTAKPKLLLKLKMAPAPKEKYPKYSLIPIIAGIIVIFIY